MAFPFKGPESGHRQQRHHARCACDAATLLFHPDSDRRLRNCTESADPFSSEGREALAGLGLSVLTAGGEFHPALRRSAAGSRQSLTTMTKRRRPGKRLCHLQAARAHAATKISGTNAIQPQKINDLTAEPFPIPICSL